MLPQMAQLLEICGEVQSFECHQFRFYKGINLFTGGGGSPKFWKHFYPPTHHTLMQAASDICSMKMPEHVVTR